MPDSAPARSLLHAPNLNHLWAQLLVEELVRCGVDVFFLAPGSRSTPLTTAVAQHPEVRTVMHYDERGTAFAALGYGRVTGRPAGWVTTSGTAVANGFPAVVEAATDGVPLVLLTADRPPELRDTGANQTIDQVKLFGAYVRWQFDLPTPSVDIAPTMVLTTVDQAVHRATRMPPGPVHLNCMFRKPLHPQPDAADREAYTALLAAWAEGAAPYTRYPSAQPRPDAAEIDAVAGMADRTERGVLIAGRLGTEAERRAVHRLAERLGWPLLPDITSGLRLGRADASRRVAYTGHVLASETFRDTTVPAGVIQIGGRFVSEQLRTYLEAVRPEHYIVVRADPSRIDPSHQATRHVESDIASFCTRLADATATGAGQSAWARRWMQADQAVAKQLNQWEATNDALSEPLVARLVARHVPQDHTLVLASSMPVRDMNRYATTEGADVSVVANRGASGIDGTVATAAGVAHGRDAPATLIIGDLALLHDLNSLALLRAVPVVVIVVNNDGGGIFHFLPIAAHEKVFEPYFATPHGRSFEQAAAMYDLGYARPSTREALVDAYRAACAEERSMLIEVTTDRERNRALHDRLEKQAARAVERTLCQ